MIGICMALIDDTESQKKFDDIVRQYENKLFYYAYNILHDKSLAEDAVWETFFSFAKIQKNMHNEKIDNLEAYLIVTLKNCCFTIYNNEKKHKNISLQEYSSAYNEPSFEEFNDCNISDLCEALKKLDSIYQCVITYMIYYEYTAEQTAEIMGISRSTVYKYLNNAKKALCDILEKE